MTLDQHKQCAKAVKRIKSILRKINYKGQFDVQRYFLFLEGILDDDYHSIISEEQFKKLGHIYYGGKK